jgi:hypothetical protein
LSPNVTSSVPNTSAQEDPAGTAGHPPSKLESQALNCNPETAPPGTGVAFVLQTMIDVALGGAACALSAIVTKKNELQSNPTTNFMVLPFFAKLHDLHPIRRGISSHNADETLNPEQSSASFDAARLIPQHFARQEGGP